MSGGRDGAGAGDELALHPALLRDVYAHALAGHPEEVCGLILGPRGAAADEVRRCVNRQNEIHARDPARHPRTAATAYSLGLDDIALLDKSLGGPRPVQLIYHSHVEVGAYFSDEDRLMAAPPGWGPLYPGVDYLVVDVRRDGVRGARRYRCIDGDFVEIAEYSVPDLPSAKETDPLP